EERHAAEVDAEGVRPARVPRLASAARLLARPADGPRVGLFGGARHGHRHGAHPSAAREDRGRPREAAVPRDRLGRGLPLHAVIATAVIVAISTFVAGLIATTILRMLPTLRLQLTGL